MKMPRLRLSMRDILVHSCLGVRQNIAAKMQNAAASNVVAQGRLR